VVYLQVSNKKQSIILNSFLIWICRPNCPPPTDSFSYSQNSAFNFDQKNIRIRLEILLDGIDEQETLIGVQGDFGLDFHFHIENIEEFIEESEGNKKISDNLGTTLISIAYSTARGIVLERTQGTFLNGTILPVIDPKELLKNAKERDVSV